MSALLREGWTKLLRFRFAPEIGIFLVAVGCSIYAYFPALIDPYVISDDVRISLYWMYQFRDPSLFPDDLLTVYAKNYTPWGYGFIFYLCSHLMDPLLAGHVLTIMLMGVGAVYMFRLVREFAGGFAGVLSAVSFMLSSSVLSSAAGGMTRSFAWPLLLMFLYYLIRREEIQSALAVGLQCLLYPVTFLIGFLTYALTFLKWPGRGFFLETSKRRWTVIIATAVICAAALIGKHVLSYDDEIGHVYSKSEIKANPESYVFGRIGVTLPQRPLVSQLGDHFLAGSSYVDMMAWALSGVEMDEKGKLWVLLILISGFLGYEVWRRRLRFPIELLYFLVASLVLFQVAEWVMFKLYLPVRYLRYSIPLLVIILSSVAVAQLLRRIPVFWVRWTVQIAAVLLVIIFALPLDRSLYLLDVRPHKPWLEYLSTLPKDALIAAHPKLADDIPTFAKRKVLVNYEMSMPYFSEAWPAIRQRTFDFFNAYYADNPVQLYAFCKKYGVDYLVIDKLHFHPQYLQQGRFYFEPFNYVTRQLVSQRKTFVLRNIPDQHILFEDGRIFVVDTNALFPHLKEEGRNE